MKKFVFLLYVVLLFSSLSIHSEKLTEFEEPFEAVLLALDEDQIYIVDRGTNVIHIYSKKDFNHIGQFGREGQGPTDFEYIGFMRIYPEYIYISGGRKVSYFTKNGEFIKTATPFPNSGGYVPLGSNFVCKTYPGSNPKEERVNIQVELLDSKFKKKKAFYLAKFRKFVKFNFQTGKRDVLLVRDCFKLDVYNDRLYVGDTDKGFFFIVFDSRGKKLYEINLPYEKRKVTSKEKKQLIDKERKAWGEQRFNQLKASQDYIFQDHYPAYSDFVVTDGKIYVFSYPNEDDPREILISDLKGNFLKKATIPKGRISYYIYKDRYYYMIYNEETYRWELHVEMLD